MCGAVTKLVVLLSNVTEELEGGIKRECFPGDFIDVFANSGPECEEVRTLEQEVFDCLHRIAVWA